MCSSGLAHPMPTTADDDDRRKDPSRRHGAPSGRQRGVTASKARGTCLSRRVRRVTLRGARRALAAGARSGGGGCARSARRAWFAGSRQPVRSDAFALTPGVCEGRVRLEQVPLEVAKRCLLEFRVSLTARVTSQGRGRGAVSRTHGRCLNASRHRCLDMPRCLSSGVRTDAVPCTACCFFDSRWRSAATRYWPCESNPVRLGSYVSRAQGASGDCGLSAGVLAAGPDITP